MYLFTTWNEHDSLLTFRTSFFSFLQVRVCMWYSRVQVSSSVVVPFQAVFACGAHCRCPKFVHFYDLESGQQSSNSSVWWRMATWHLILPGPFVSYHSFLLSCSAACAHCFFFCKTVWTSNPFLQSDYQSVNLHLDLQVFDMLGSSVLQECEDSMDSILSMPYLSFFLLCTLSDDLWDVVCFRDIPSLSTIVMMFFLPGSDLHILKDSQCL